MAPAHEISVVFYSD